MHSVAVFLLCLTHFKFCSICSCTVLAENLSLKQPTNVLKIH